MFSSWKTLRVAALSLAAVMAQAQQLPRKSPEFTINQVGGKPPIQLSSYKGKVIVLASILTTCPHCQHTVTLLSKLQTELGPKGLQVVASAIQEAPELAVPLFLKEFHPPFPVGYSADGPSVLAYFQYSPQKLPHMPILAFIDRQFNIRSQHEGGEAAFFDENFQEGNLRKEIDALLKDSGVKKAVPGKKSN